MQKEGRKEPLEFVEISLKAAEKNLAYPTGKGGEFYIENSLSVDTDTDGSDNQHNQSCSAIANLRKSGGNTILPGIYRATVEYEGGKCEFNVTFPNKEEAIIDRGEIQCVVSQASMSKYSIQMPEGNNNQPGKAQSVNEEKQTVKMFLFAFPDAE